MLLSVILSCYEEMAGRVTSCMYKRDAEAASEDDEGEKAASHRDQEMKMLMIQKRPK